jgi:glycosyltransferase involved in cell wall biosynthesis
VSDPWSVLVVVPAHDEEETIGDCVRSIRAALQQATIAASMIVVVADRCTDDTVAQAQRVLGRDDVVVRVDALNPGAARRTGVRIGLQRSGGALASIWIANTDADTTVPPDWIAAQLRHADRGVAAVAGIVRLQQPSEDLHERFTRHYRWDPCRPHPHVHGANLGVRADAYEAVDGWKRIGTSEDHALWNSIRASWPTVAATDVWVTTSARVHGRAHGGFSNDLRLICEADGA